MGFSLWKKMWWPSWAGESSAFFSSNLLFRLKFINSVSPCYQRSLKQLFSTSIIYFQEFPGFPVVRTLCFPFREHGFNSWSRELRSCLLYIYIYSQRFVLLHKPSSLLSRGGNWGLEHYAIQALVVESPLYPPGSSSILWIHKNGFIHPQRGSIFIQ